MGGAEGVVFALGAAGGAGEAAALTQGGDTVATTGEDLVRIGLVPDVPDHSVARRLEDIVQGHGQLYDAKARAEMSPGHRHRVDGCAPQFVSDLPQLASGHLAQVAR